MAGEIFPDDTDDDGFCMMAILLVRSMFESDVCNGRLIRHLTMASVLLHLPSGHLPRAPTISCLSNRSARAGKRRKRRRLEENSEVQRVGEKFL
jgi:hypothetical protein